ncbi:hypothetical protein LSAT2_008398 [Lamellibrachia satsuma]|nr:hypothetical protein LSAT2_008398 [Lamellibrachia satsuma]
MEAGQLEARVFVCSRQCNDTCPVKSRKGLLELRQTSTGANFLRIDMKIIIVASVVLVAMVLRCHSDSEFKPKSCFDNCDALYGEACVTKCDSLITGMSMCHKKCLHEFAQCNDDCMPW